MKIQQAINHMVYSSDPKVAPKGINQIRWNAMVKFIQKNLVKLLK